MDVSRLANLGWEYTIKLEDGIKETYRWFVENEAAYKEVKI
jgi:GDP-L-fucose synthase